MALPVTGGASPHARSIRQREGTMECDRRSFLRHLGTGTLGLGFGVSVFPQIYQSGEALAQTGGHDLHMKGIFPSGSGLTAARARYRNLPLSWEKLWAPLMLMGPGASTASASMRAGYDGRCSCRASRVSTPVRGSFQIWSSSSVDLLAS
jgi:hypothetical protein